MNVGTHLLSFNPASSTRQPSYSKKKGKREGRLSSFVELEMALLKRECCCSCLFFKQRPFWIAWHGWLSRRTTPNILWIARNSGRYSWRMFGKLRAIPNFITFSFCIHHLYLAIITWQKTTNESARYNQAQLYNKCKLSRGYACWPSYQTLRCWQTLG